MADIATAADGQGGRSARITIAHQVRQETAALREFDLANDRFSV